MLTVALLGASKDFRNLQPVIDPRIGRASVLRFEMIVHFIL